MTELDILLGIGKTLLRGEMTIEISILTGANLLDSYLQFTRNGRIIFPHSGDSSIIKNFILSLHDEDFTRTEKLVSYLSEGLIQCFDVRYRYEIFKMIVSQENKNDCLNVMSIKSYEHLKSTIDTYL